MSKKLPSLSAALAVADRPAEQVASAAKAPPRQKPSRVGTRQIGGHFSPEASKQLRLIALEHDTTVQELLREAINDLYVKYGKSPIA